MKVKKNEKPAYTPTVEEITKVDVATPRRIVFRTLSEVKEAGDFKPGEVLLRDPVDEYLEDMRAPAYDGHTPKANLTDKDTNPKDAIASNKVPLSLVPEILVVYAAMGFLEGALKYGKYNWRIAGVRSSIYIDALKRHIAAYESGEDISEHGVPHFSNMLACIGILIDAKVCGKLNDDRPPRATLVPQIIRQMEEDVARLKERFKEHHPHQYTIVDGPEGAR